MKKETKPIKKTTKKAVSKTAKPAKEIAGKKIAVKLLAKNDAGATAIATIEGVVLNKKVTLIEIEKIKELVTSYNSNFNVKTLNKLKVLMSPKKTEKKLAEIVKKEANKKTNRKDRKQASLKDKGDDRVQEIKKDMKKSAKEGAAVVHIRRKAIKKSLSEVEEKRKAPDADIAIIDSTKDFLKEREKILDELFTKTEDNSDAVYYKKFNIKIGMPNRLVETIIKEAFQGNPIEHLELFWIHCLLSPNNAARVKLFEWLENHEMLITKNGNVLAGRNWQSTRVEGVYTDGHTKTMKLEIGKKVWMKRIDCDENAFNTCSRGLHLGNANFMRSGGVGNVPVLCLFNPINVVSIPYREADKMRVCEYFPIAIADMQDRITNVEYMRNYLDTNWNTIDNDYEYIKKEELAEIIKEINTTGKSKVWIAKLKEMFAAGETTLELGENDKLTNGIDLDHVRNLIEQRTKIIKEYGQN